jgi:hypothetical protein
MFDGIAKPTPAFACVPPDAICALTPTTSPFRLSSGPPELPGLIAASVWMASGMPKDLSAEGIVPHLSAHLPVQLSTPFLRAARRSANVPTALPTTGFNGRRSP